MWRLVAEAERLEASANPDDAIVARVVRYHASRVAEMAAPFCHPRMGVAIVDD
jgi:hypothetical protein